MSLILAVCAAEHAGIHVALPLALFWINVAQFSCCMKRTCFGRGNEHVLCGEASQPLHTGTAATIAAQRLRPDDHLHRHIIFFSIEKHE